MSDDEIDSVEALLEQARRRVSLPDPRERRRLREAAHLSREQIGDATGVSQQTVAGWENGSTPKEPARSKYLRLLEGLAQLHPAPAAVEPMAPALVAPADAQTARGSDGLALQSEEEGPCLRCGVPTTYLSTDGRPLHAGAMCQPPAPAAAPKATPAAPSSPVPAPVPTRPQRRAKSAARAQAENTALITDAVDAELERAGGDIKAATKALVKRAVPDVVALFNETRATGRYQYTSYPGLPDILKKPEKDEPDQIWEARPAFHHPDYSFKAGGSIAVTALDMNAAYLSALKCWLPIGKLEHTVGAEGFDRKRSGVHLITPAQWCHPHLPNPLGDRDVEGALWVTDATLRLLMRLTTPKYGLTEAPEIHESWTSGATENFFESLRRLFAAARENAIAEEDSVTEVYVKAMYSKLVSTMGESIYNREMIRPDWMHIIHSQAYANLWGRAYKAHQAGLEVIAMMGTDELHVTGDWRSVFTKGRGLSDMKIKEGDNKASGEYTIGKVSR